MITRKEFRDWQDHHVTKRIFELLKRDREENNEMLLGCVPSYQSKENCLMIIGKIIGKINALDLILEVDYDLVEPDGEKGDMQ